MFKHFSILIFSVCAVSLSATAQTPRQLKVLTDTFDVAIHDAEVFGAANMKYTFDKWGKRKYKKWDRQFRGALEDRLGLTKLKNQLSEYHPVARLDSIQQCDGFRREYYKIWTEPTMPLPIIVMIPDNV